VQWSANNPLQFWVTDNAVGVTRRPLFNVATSNPSVRTEAQTLAIGTTFTAFRSMEGNPHGSTHVAFGGSISSVPSAARDPLFFLLHCNVDRLWALWQRDNARFDPAVAASFDNSSTIVGHRLNDTMWPWNGVTGGTRPPTAPGGTLATSPCTAAPGPSPRVSDMLDYQGRISAAARAAFDYDTVAFA
jgi:tyrosinase